MSRERTVHRNVFGGCAVLKRDLFDLVGGYDEALGRRGADCSGGEEADFCLRVSAADPAARFVHVPDAVIHHRVGGSRLTRRYVINRCFSDGRTKSLIARRSTGTGLRPEWRYLIRTVPLGVLRALVTGRWQAAAVLAAGVVGAGAGYLAGRTRWRRVIRRSPAPAGQS